MPELKDIVYRPHYKVDVIIDPLVEELACLHVLKQEEQDEDWGPWIKDMRETMGEALWQELDELYRRYYELHFLMDTASYSALKQSAGYGERSIFDAMAGFISLPDEEFILYMLGLEVVPEEEHAGLLADADKAVARMEGLYGPIMERSVMEEIIADPSGVRQRCQRFLETFWSCYFHSQWEGISTYMHRIARQERAQLEMTDVGVLLAQDVDNITRVDGDSYIFGDQSEFPVRLSKLTNVHLFLSSYVGERLWYNIIGTELTLYLHVPYQWEENLPDPEEQTMTALKGLGDQQRMKILRLLWQREATTQQLAQILNLAESTVSAHLKMLKASGLVQSMRQKKNVIYIADRKRIETILEQIHKYLDVH